MIKASLLTTALIFPGATFADDCASIAEQLGASYLMVEESAKDKHQRSYQMKLWRKGNQVIHQYPDSQISELWQLVRNGRIGSVRYFDEHQRAIEYQPGEKLGQKENRDWSIKFQLVSDQLLSSMTLLERSGEGCEVKETYVNNSGGQFTQIEWLPEKKLVKAFSHVKAGKSISWTLQSTVEDRQQVAAQMTLRDSYQATDFADIGDNESDPFLLGMINLGFIEHGTSGFYNTEGKEIGEGRHH